MSWKNGRPDGWKKCTVDNLTNYEGLIHAQCFEAGADAMYKSAYKKGQRDLIERYKRENPSSYEKYRVYWDRLLEEAKEVE